MDSENSRQSYNTNFRKSKSEEFLENKKLTILRNSDEEDQMMDDPLTERHKQMHKDNLRKSMDSISISSNARNSTGSGGYEPVYKNYRYQPQFKPLTAWASSQRDLALANSEAENLNSPAQINHRQAARKSYDETKFSKAALRKEFGNVPGLAQTRQTQSTDFKPKVQSVHFKDEFRGVEMEDEILTNKLNESLESLSKLSPPINVTDDVKSSNQPVLETSEPVDQVDANSEVQVIESDEDQLKSDDEQQPQEDTVIVYPIKHTEAVVVDSNQINEDVSNEEKDKNEENRKSSSLPWKWKKRSSAKQKNSKIVANLYEFDKYKTSNIPKLLVTCVKCLHTKQLLTTKGIYRSSASHDLINDTMKKAIKDKNFTSIENTTDGILVAALIKQFFKRLSTPLLKSTMVDEKLKDEDFKDKLALKEIDDEIISTLKEVIGTLNEVNKEVFLYFILHLEQVEKQNSFNFMDYPNLARVLAPCLFSNESFPNFDMFILLSNQSLLLQTILENYRSLFDDLILQEVQFYFDDSILSDTDKLILNGGTETPADKPNESKHFNFMSISNMKSKWKNSYPTRQPPPIPVEHSSEQITSESNQQSSIFYELDGTGESAPTPPPENIIKDNFLSFNKRLNIETVVKQPDTNIPELVYMIVQSLTANNLNGTEYIYEKDMNYEEMQSFVDMVKRHNDDELKKFNNGNHLAYFLKEYVKLFDPPLLKDPIPDFAVYRLMTNDFSKLHIEEKKYSEYINWIEPTSAKQTFMFLIKHLNDVSILSEKNQMTPKKLSKIWNQCLFSEEMANDEKNIKFLEYCINNYKKLFNATDLIVVQDLFRQFDEVRNLPFSNSDSTKHCCVIS